MTTFFTQAAKSQTRFSSTYFHSIRLFLRGQDGANRIIVFVSLVCRQPSSPFLARTRLREQHAISKTLTSICTAVAACPTAPLGISFRLRTGPITTQVGGTHSVCLGSLDTSRGTREESKRPKRKAVV